MKHGMFVTSQPAFYRRQARCSQTGTPGERAASSSRIHASALFTSEPSASYPRSAHPRANRLVSAGNSDCDPPWTEHAVLKRGFDCSKQRALSGPCLREMGRFNQWRWMVCNTEVWVQQDVAKILHSWLECTYPLGGKGTCKKIRGEMQPFLGWLVL